MTNRKIQRRVCRYIGHWWRVGLLSKGIMPSWNECRWCGVVIDRKTMSITVPLSPPSKPTAA